MGNTAQVQSSIFSDGAKVPAGVDLDDANRQSTVDYWRDYHTQPFSYLVQDTGGSMVQSSVGNMFFRVSDAGFGLQNDGASVGETVKAMMTTIYFGLPLKGYTSTDGQDYEDQKAEIESFMYAAYNDVLEAESEWEVCPAGGLRQLSLCARARMAKFHEPAEVP